MLKDTRSPLGPFSEVRSPTRMIYGLLTLSRQVYDVLGAAGSLQTRFYIVKHGSLQAYAQSL